MKDKLIQILIYIAFFVFLNALPIAVGVVAVFLSKTGKKAEKIFRVFGTVFECFDPLVYGFFAFYLFFAYFRLKNINSLLNIFIYFILLSLCFCGYIASRYNREWSVKKNIFVNTASLLSTTLKWCVLLLILYLRFRDLTLLLILIAVTFALVFLLEWLKLRFREKLK